MKARFGLVPDLQCISFDDWKWHIIPVPRFARERLELSANRTSSVVASTVQVYELQRLESSNSHLASGGRFAALCDPLPRQLVGNLCRRPPFGIRTGKNVENGFIETLNTLPRLLKRRV